MNDRPRLTRIALALFLLLIVGGLIFRGRDYSSETLRLDESILPALEKSGIKEKDLLYRKQERYKSGRHIFLKIERHYKVEADFDEDSFLKEVDVLLRKSKFKLEKSVFEKEEREEGFSILLSLKNKILYEIKFLKKIYPRAVSLESRGVKIAIVLDDFGYNMDNVDSLFAIDTPLTLSILPDLPYSEEIAKQASDHNLEVVLHLPLEPHRKLNLERDTIMVDMPADEIHNLLKKTIESVPRLKGVSNHMGSKATEDRNLMREIFKELKKRELYFLDNLVTNKSVCKEVGRELGVRTALRSVFLDVRLDEQYIEKQILHTASLAAKNGWAIAVGHDRPSTVKVLSRIIPQLKEEGFEFVHVSELVR